MVGVLFANRRYHFVDPCLRNFFLGTAGELEGEPLHKISVAKGAGRPVPRLFVFRYDWLIHEVIAEDRRAAAAGRSHRFPETRLNVPSWAFVQVIVPLRSVFFVVAAEAGDIEIQGGLFGERYEASELL